jgi:hypothetical protein
MCLTAPWQITTTQACGSSPCYAPSYSYSVRYTAVNCTTLHSHVMYCPKLHCILLHRLLLKLSLLTVSLFLLPLFSSIMLQDCSSSTCCPVESKSRSAHMPYSVSLFLCLSPDSLHCPPPVLFSPRYHALYYPILTYSASFFVFYITAVPLHFVGKTLTKSHTRSYLSYSKHYDTNLSPLDSSLSNRLSSPIVLHSYFPLFSQAELQASDTNSKAAGSLFLSVVFCSLSFVIGFTLVTIIAPTAWG